MENNTLHAKLLAFQKKGIKINKDALNPHFKSKYASLTNIIEKITPALNEIGLTITHSLYGDKVITTISDGSSQITSEFPIFGQKAQDFGASISYGRRYNIGALLNLDIDDDDDGNQANEAKRVVNKPKFNQEAFEKLVSVKDKFSNAEEAIKAAKQKYVLTDNDQEAIICIF